jgi:alkylation response protein AidB-like acyl-CoA dehydrogenase
VAEPDFYLSEEQRELQRALREFVGKEITPIADRCDAEERFPVELFRKMGSLGYLGLTFPEQIGGSGGSNLDYAILCEELAHGSAGIALGIYVHVALACSVRDPTLARSRRAPWPTATAGS